MDRNTNIMDLTEIEKNNLVAQYEPLINKITKQFASKMPVDWMTVKSMAYEGFALALQKYDPNKSDMTFLQFAGFSIRNTILTGLDNELRIVKLSHYAQKKAVLNGDALFNSVSISGDDGSEDDRSIKLKDRGCQNHFDDGNVYDYIYYRLEHKFTTRDCDIFYHIFGLKNYEEMKGKDVAKKFEVSEGLVSQKIKKITDFIRKDEELCEMLANLVTV